MECRDSTFYDTSIEVDDNKYFGCTFSDVVLIFRGGPPPSFDTCSFSNTRFEFRDHAGNTVGFLKAMANPASGLQGFVLDTFPELKGQ